MASMQELLNRGFSPKQAEFLAGLDGEIPIEATTSALGLVKKSANVNLVSTNQGSTFADLAAATTAYNTLRTDVSNLLTALKATDCAMGA